MRSRYRRSGCERRGDHESAPCRWAGGCVPGAGTGRRFSLASPSAGAADDARWGALDAPVGRETVVGLSAGLGAGQFRAGPTCRKGPRTDPRSRHRQASPPFAVLSRPGMSWALRRALTRVRSPAPRDGAPVVDGGPTTLVGAAAARRAPGAGALVDAVCSGVDDVAGDHGGPRLQRDRAATVDPLGPPARVRRRTMCV